MPTHTATLTIDGMHCGHCVKTVRGALEQTAGVEVVNVEIGSATIRLNDAVVDLATITEAVDDTGFEVVGSSVD